MSISKAFYKSDAPKLLHKFSNNATKSVEIWTTSCIVTNFGSENADLVNPSNPELSGCSNFSYFPRGGPVPEPVTSMHKDWQPLGYVSQWGGMEVGSGMLYRVSVVDGLVHQHAGWKLAAELKVRRALNSQPCPVGSAVKTTAGNLIYRSILHTTPPFYKHDTNPEQMLLQCYKSVLDCMGSILCVPLLGAGARGFPYEVAIRVAADAVSSWMESGITELTANNLDASTNYGPEKQIVAFGLLQELHAHQLAEAIRKQLETMQ